MKSGIAIPEPIILYAKSQIIQNIALFGRSIEEKIIAVKCINRLVLNKIKYDVLFGPVGY